MNIIYFHGFNSASKKGNKYLALESVFNQEIHIPNLDYTSPTLFENTREYLNSLNGRKLVVGTSLGGYMAMHFATLGKCEAWVFNPTTNPHKSLKKYLGTQTNFVTGEVYEWTDYSREIFCDFFVIYIHPPNLRVNQ